ncbi:MAG: oligogalacturonate lyase family protein [Bacteroidales bacterium]|nr:oligogalacturonate lyase family protein [Bacteroidales bacterium]
MKHTFFYAAVLALLLPAGNIFAQSKAPLEWTDTITGHRVIRLTRTGVENYSFYFHNNPFIKSTDGKTDLMVYTGMVDGLRQYFSVNLKTLESVQLSNRSQGIKGGSASEIFDKTHREVIYQTGDSIFAVHIDSRKTRLIHVFPESLGVTVSSVNANGTLLAGKYSEGKQADKIREQYPEKSQYFNRIYDAHIKHYLFIFDMRTKEMKIIHEENEWINHIQFSPTDPDLLMFCHEGPWHKVDRIWNINVKTGELRLMHKRTMDGEIAGHEFWGPDGKTIWFDLQQPRSVTFFLCGADAKTGKEVKYEMTRDEWSIHFNVSPDRSLFCGDGGDPGQVARAQDGMWIYLFRPQDNKFVSERLVNMKHHYYKLEPNVHFSPDQKWVIFRSNMFGETHVYAVEITKK